MGLGPGTAAVVDDPVSKQQFRGPVPGTHHIPTGVLAGTHQIPGRLFLSRGNPDRDDLIHPR
jgi:hypothetical protein